jgi:hypothetical protein
MLLRKLYQAQKDKAAIKFIFNKQKKFLTFVLSLLNRWYLQNEERAVAFNQSLQRCVETGGPYPSFPVDKDLVQSTFDVLAKKDKSAELELRMKKFLLELKDTWRLDNNDATSAPYLKLNREYDEILALLNVS